MNWTEQQEKALTDVENWYKSKPRKQIFRVFGYAGVGKTSLAKHFASSIDGDVIYAAYTGKAASVMRKNGCTGAQTIHSLIYKIEDENVEVPTFVLNKQSALRRAKLLIVDECSMVDKEIGEDLLSFGKPILVLGDPAQLPPVGGAGFFTDAKPDVMLTEIHRQARDNPIVYLATAVREGKRLMPGQYGDSLVTKSIMTKDLIDHDQVIVGRNATRDEVNRKVRKILKRTDELPMPEDKLICLRNDREKCIYNGEMFTVLNRWENKRNLQYPTYKIEDFEDEQRTVVAKVHNSCFDGSTKPEWKLLRGTQEFDFGYGITCHKSQGSQWDSVLVFDESWCFRDDAQRWLYTAITRAQTRLTIYQ